MFTPLVERMECFSSENRRNFLQTYFDAKDSVDLRMLFLFSRFGKEVENKTSRHFKVFLASLVPSRPRNGPPGPMARPGPAQPGPTDFSSGPGGPSQIRPMGRAGLSFGRATRPELRTIFFTILNGCRLRLETCISF